MAKPGRNLVLARVSKGSTKGMELARGIEPRAITRIDTNDNLHCSIGVCYKVCYIRPITQEATHEIPQESHT